MNFNWSSVVKSNRARVSSEQIRLFEVSLGFGLPSDYRDFLEKFNGGRVFVEHDFRVRDVPFDLAVNSFLPLTAPSPFIGVVEARDLQVRNRLYLWQMLPIAHDGGTGEYLLVLDGKRRGAVFFIWVDNIVTVPLSDWGNSEVNIPDDMVEISPSFDALGELILAGR